MDMNTLKQAITNVVSARFPGMVVEFDPPRRYGKLHGAFVWDGFAGLSHIDRQHLVWAVLRPELTEEQRLSTGLMLALTTQELAAMHEDVAV